MQLNRVLGRIRMVRPRRAQLLSTVARTQFLTHRRWVNNTREPKQPSDQMSNKIENKLDKVLANRSAEVARASGAGYTGDQYSDKGSFSSSSSLPGSSGYMGTSMGKSSTYDKLSNTFATEEGSPSSVSQMANRMAEKITDKFTGNGSLSDMANKVADKVSETFSGGNSSDRSGARGSDRSGSNSNMNSSSSSNNMSSGGRGLSDNQFSQNYNLASASNDYNPSSSSGDYRSSNDRYSAGREGSSSYTSDSSSSSYKPSSSSYNQSSSSYNPSSSSSSSSYDNNRYSGNKSYEGGSSPSSSSSGSSSFGGSGSSSFGGSSSGGLSSSSYSGDRSYDNNRYSGDRSYEGGSSSRNDSSSSTGTLGEAFNKMSDKISEGSSTIGQTLHKISDKISETFSGGGDQSSSYQRGDSQGKMMRSRNNRSSSSSLNPFDLSSFFRNNFFGNLSETFSGQSLSMRTDIIERDTEYRVMCDLPGVDKKDVNISLRKNYLEIYGERSEGYNQDDSDTVHCQERYFGSFTRRLSLPDDAAKDMSRIKAKCENGVLTVTIPKSQGSSSSRDRYNINIE